MTGCCSPPVEENGNPIEFSEISALHSARLENICPTSGETGKMYNLAVNKMLPSFLVFSWPLYKPCSL